MEVRTWLLRLAAEETELPPRAPGCVACKLRIRPLRVPADAATPRKAFCTAALEGPGPLVTPSGPQWLAWRGPWPEAPSLPPLWPHPQSSQVTLLQLADKHQQALPLQCNDYRQRLELLAARTQAEAAEAQLAAAAAAGPVAAGSGEAVQQQHPQAG